MKKVLIEQAKRVAMMLPAITDKRSTYSALHKRYHVIYVNYNHKRRIKRLLQRTEQSCKRMNLSRRAMVDVLNNTVTDYGNAVRFIAQAAQTHISISMPDGLTNSLHIHKYSINGNRQKSVPDTKRVSGSNQ